MLIRLHYANIILIALLFNFCKSSPSQIIFSSSNNNEDSNWNPLLYSSGISPYHDAPGANISPPKGCKVTAATFLIRHSSIFANDDEWEEYMKPFVERVYENRQAFKQQQQSNPLEFLSEWKSPINEENLEKLTEPGKKDAKAFGKRIRKLYPHLLPPKNLGRKKERFSKLKVKTPFKIWTASSERDIGSAKSFIQGAFPKSQEGDDGQGDGKYLSLIEVPNKDKNWSTSLTPHKVCDKFTKEDGRNDAREFLKQWGNEPLEKLKLLIPTFPWEIKDVIAIQMLCGYESVIKGINKSNFCSKSIFNLEDYKNYEYFHDLIYHKMVGYESPVAANLGIHWVNTSLHNLLISDEGKGDHPRFQLNHYKQQKNSNSFQQILPNPNEPPNGTHSQKLFIYFTHREEPPMVLVSLNLWNQTKIGPLPLNKRIENRIWKTSNILPFLGHIALERLECKFNSKEDFFIRVIINGAVQSFQNCNSGPGKSCPIEEFKDFVKERMLKYGDIEKACSI